MQQSSASNANNNTEKKADVAMSARPTSAFDLHQSVHRRFLVCDLFLCFRLYLLQCEAKRGMRPDEYKTTRNRQQVWMERQGDKQQSARAVDTCLRRAKAFSISTTFASNRSDT
jgi:hypothetical protein